MVKLSIVSSDPVNGLSNPKAIPGAIVEYQIIVTNPSATPIDSGSVMLTAPFPGAVALRVADFTGPGSGPLLFSQGAPVSGLHYTFTSPARTTVDADSSSTNYGSWVSVPLPEAP